MGRKQSIELNSRDKYILLDKDATRQIKEDVSKITEKGGAKLTALANSILSGLPASGKP